VPALANKKVDWLDGRNLCREYCMDLVALETQEKNNLIFRVIQQNDVPYIWTAGRICDFAGCEMAIWLKLRCSKSCGQRCRRRRSRSFSKLQRAETSTIKQFAAAN